MAGLMFPKPRPRALEKLDRRKALEARDKSENAKVKVRSGGRCEAWVETDWRREAIGFLETGRHPGHPGRCTRRAVHIHHLMGGVGVRGRGLSALAKNKVHVCPACHSAIHAHVLVPLGGTRFQRVT